MCVVCAVYVFLYLYWFCVLVPTALGAMLSPGFPIEIFPSVRTVRYVGILGKAVYSYRLETVLTLKRDAFESASERTAKRVRHDNVLEAGGQAEAAEAPIWVMWPPVQDALVDAGILSVWPPLEGSHAGVVSSLLV